MAERPSRKLAVILHADVVGSTALVRLDETLAHERIQDTFRRFSRTISSYDGTAHEIRGDALVAEFSRASDAVSAALAFQGANAAHNEELSDDIRPAVRVGIAMGEVVVADNTVTGEGIVLAQRLEQLAEPGGVCLQGAIYETVPKRLPFDYESQGEQTLKGFEHPVRAYKVTSKVGETVPVPESVGRSEESVLELPDKPSIAVLPFTNMSGDPEQEYFSDGITEDIITALSRFREIFVIARNSSFTFKDRSVDVVEIGERLGVRYVVEGSIRKSGKRVRITAQLIDASTADHLWANRYDRDLGDVFAVQDEVCETVVATLAGRLVEISARRAKRKRPNSLTAYDYLMRGRELLYRYSREDVGEARRMFSKALALDPDYAAAHAGLAQTHWADWHFGWIADPDEAFQRFGEAAEKAVAQDDTDSQTQMEMGIWPLFRRQYEQARFHLEKAISLNPNEPDALMCMAWYAMFTGDPEGGLKLVRRAQRLDPFGRYGFILGLLHYSARSYDEAVVALTTVRALPTVPTVVAWLAASYARLDRVDDARLAAERFLEIARSQWGQTGAAMPQSWLTWFRERLPFQREADLEHVLEGMRRASIE